MKPGLLPMLSAALAASGIAITATAHAQPGTHSHLTAIAGQGAGIVEIAPAAHDVVAPGTLRPDAPQEERTPA